MRGRDAFAAALAQRFSIRAIPALLFFSGGDKSRASQARR
jgi:hypothetical protein